MFCPVCKAEYRQGFTVCADCDVALVDSYREAVEDRQAWQNIADGANNAYEIWRGKDPHFYIALIDQLWHYRVPCLGRPTRAPMPAEFGGSLYSLPSDFEFEVRVAEANAGVGRWVLESFQEYNAKNDDQQTEGLPEDRGEPGVNSTALICPLCEAEFDSGIAACSNCGVALRTQTHTSSDDYYAKNLSSLPHPGFVSGLQTALRDAGIPFNNVNLAGMNALLSWQPIRNHNVHVLRRDYERASRVLGQVLSHWELEPGSGFGAGENPLRSYWPHRATENGWTPEELSTLAWSSKWLHELTTIASVLRDFNFAFCLDTSELGVGKVFVHPEDVDNAREIIRNALEGPEFE